MKTVSIKSIGQNLTFGLAALVMSLVTTACGSSNNNSNPAIASVYGYGVGTTCVSCPGGETIYQTTAVSDNFTGVGSQPQQPVQLALSFFGTQPVSYLSNGMPAMVGQIAAQGTLQLWVANSCGLPAGTYQLNTISQDLEAADGYAWGPIIMQVQGTSISIAVEGTFDGGPQVGQNGQQYPFRFGGAIDYFINGTRCAAEQGIQ
jgi:hypothetical protein